VLLAFWMVIQSRTLAAGTTTVGVGDDGIEISDMGYGSI
jgi:hypothetical protein